MSQSTVRQSTVSQATVDQIQPTPIESVAANPATQQECFDVVSAGVVENLSNLRAFARSLTRNPHQADDLVHDAVVRALSAAHQFMPGTNFKAWIFTILRNLYYNQGRKPWSRHLPLDDLTINEPSVRASQEDALAFCDFRRAFWQLAPEHREVLTLVGASGMSYEEAAAVCLCPIGTVKSRVSRGRRELKELLESRGLDLPRQALQPVAEADLDRLLETAAGPHAEAKYRRAAE
jgi:RNA polymerase sigma-70 factor (ECF subfamily)